MNMRRPILIAALALAAAGSVAWIAWVVGLRGPAVPQGNPLNFPLPNVEGGTPLHRNFYERDPRELAYLRVMYDVLADPYDPASEATWMRDSLEQIRALGPNRFPPVSFVAVAIFNRHEQRGRESFARAHKVAAIFDARDVFDAKVPLEDLVARAKPDRDPFMLDGDRQRWLIVERHMAAAPQ